MKLFHKSINDILFKPFHAKGQALQNQNVVKRIHNQSRKPVAFGKNETAASEVRKGAPVFDRFMNPAEYGRRQFASRFIASRCR